VFSLSLSARGEAWEWWQFPFTNIAEESRPQPAQKVHNKKLVNWSFSRCWEKERERENRASGENLHNLVWNFNFDPEVNDKILTWELN
jgi:hypothetical protein